MNMHAKLSRVRVPDSEGKLWTWAAKALKRRLYVDYSLGWMIIALN